MTGPDRVSLAHTLNAGVLSLVLGAMVVAAALLDAGSTVVRRHYESESWAYERCEDSPQAGCIAQKLAKSDLEAVRTQLLFGLTGAIIGTGGILWLRHSRPARRHVVELSGDGSG